MDVFILKEEILPPKIKLSLFLVTRELNGLSLFYSLLFYLRFLLFYKTAFCMTFMTTPWLMGTLVGIRCNFCSYTFIVVYQKATNRIQYRVIVFYILEIGKKLIEKYTKRNQENSYYKGLVWQSKEEILPVSHQLYLQAVLVYNLYFIY